MALEALEQKNNIYSIIKDDDLDQLKLLIAEGLDVNQVVKNGDVLLHLAVRQGNFEMVKLLCEAGANDDLENEQHKTPLECISQMDLASDENYVKIASYLNGRHQAKFPSRSPAKAKVDQLSFVIENIKPTQIQVVLQNEVCVSDDPDKVLFSAGFYTCYGIIIRDNGNRHIRGIAHFDQLALMSQEMLGLQSNGNYFQKLQDEFVAKEGNPRNCTVSFFGGAEQNNLFLPGIVNSEGGKKMTRMLHDKTCESIKGKLSKLFPNADIKYIGSVKDIASKANHAPEENNILLISGPNKTLLGDHGNKHLCNMPYRDIMRGEHLRATSPELEELKLRNAMIGKQLSLKTPEESVSAAKKLKREGKLASNEQCPVM
ncbi:MAG: ankyrin repeat domain-containing protein [Pseudomonadota bacterium]